MRREIIVVAAMAATLLAGCEKKGENEQKGLVVNGVEWTTCNVAEAGRFTRSAVDYGGYFDFESAQTACPTGWRTPTQVEWSSLMSVAKVFTTQSGINGLRVGYARGLDSIFLPASGSVNKEGIANYMGLAGWYWSATRSESSSEEPTAYATMFGNQIPPAVDDGYLFVNRFSVRCVRTL